MLDLQVLCVEQVTVNISAAFVGTQIKTFGPSASLGFSGDTVRNYISLTNLVPELMQMVDEKKIALSPAYQIAALKPEEQQMLVTTIDYEHFLPI